MFGHTGRVFEIYSIGDGLYMQRVLNGVAGLSNSGILLQLLALGLVIGVLVMGVRNVIHGGNKLELGTLFTSLILGIFLFGMRADVAVIDVSYVPGQKTQGDFVVANIPFGVAAMGSLISNAGFILTSRMEQAFSVPGMEEMGMAKGGFGKTLEWITSVRLWETPLSPPGEADRNALMLWRNNLNNYLAECTLPALEMGHLSYDVIRSAPNPLVYGDPTVGGIGYRSKYFMVGIVEAIGAPPVVYTCEDGFVQLVNRSGPGFEAFVSALGSTFFDSGGAAGASATLQNAFDAIGYSAAEVQGLVLSESVGMSMNNMLVNAKSGLALAHMNELMIEQASRQRLVQWAAEETMFRRIMRPMMAFFESLMYALAPFMALAVGLGTFGIMTVFRYMMLTVWVVLWMPVLSIIQLFQITSVQHTVTAMKNAMDGSEAMGVTSIASAELLRSEAMEWMATGAALAAWTPAITMALVWSGSVTASALAGKMQGQDTINEKLSAPDTVNASPSIQRGSSYEHTAGSGLVKAGLAGSIPTISWGQTTSMAERSENARSADISRRASTELASTLSSDFTRSEVDSIAKAVGFTGTLGDGKTGAARQGSGTQSGESNSAATGSDRYNSEDVTMLARFLASIGASGGGSGVGLSGGVNQQNARGSRENLRTGNDATIQSGQEAGHINTRTGGSQLVIDSAIREGKANNESWADKLSDTRKNSSTLQHAQTLSSNYSQNAENRATLGTQQNETVGAAAVRAASMAGSAESAYKSLYQAAQATNSMQAYSEARSMLSSQGLAGRDLDNAALITALSGHMDNWDSVKKSGIASKDDRAAALVDAMDGSYGQGGSIFGGGIAPSSNSGVADGVSWNDKNSIGQPTAPSASEGELRRVKDAGPKEWSHQTPSELVGNTAGGGDENLDPGSSSGSGAYTNAERRGNEAEQVRSLEGNASLGSFIDQSNHQSVFGGNPSDHLKKPMFGDGVEQFEPTSGWGGPLGETPIGSRVMFDQAVLDKSEKLGSEVPQSVVEGIVLNDMLSNKIPVGMDLTSQVNAGIRDDMDSFDRTMLKNATDQSTGAIYQDRLAARSRSSGDAEE